MSEAFERSLAWRRDLLREALAGRTVVTPLQAYVALGRDPGTYGLRQAEAVCAVLAGIGFRPIEQDSWSLVNMEAAR